MKSHKSIYNIFAVLFQSMLLVAAGMRIYEWHAAASIGASITEPTFWESFFHDLSFAAAISLGAMPVVYIWYLLHRKSVYTLIYSIVILYVVLSVLLIQYYVESLFPLDQIMYHYSASELLFIATSSTQSNMWWFIVKLCVAIIMAVLIIRYSIQFSATYTLYISLSIIAIIVGFNVHYYTYPAIRKLYDKEYTIHFADNKIEYFIRSTTEYFEQKKTLNTQDYQEMVSTFRSYNQPKHYVQLDYPLMHTWKPNDVLGEYFDLPDSLPNIVIFIMESFGRSISGKDASVVSLTPFLDSLSTKSLVWHNFLSNAGRTYGALPNILGSLPWAESGFTALKTMPHHTTILSQLAPYYYTNFFYGGWAYFDKMSVFLQKNSIDFLLEQNKFDTIRYTKTKANEEGFSWGYADEDVHTHSFEHIQATDTTPRLDIYLNLSSHSPWITPRAEQMSKEFDSYIAHKHLDEKTLQEVENRRKHSITFFYADKCLQEYFSYAEKQAWFKNTIFIITGDHRQEFFEKSSVLDPYFVPLIIYSPLLKKAATFEGVCTHIDIAPTLLSLLQHNYTIQLPRHAHWLGYGLNTSTTFSNERTYCFMNGNRKLQGILWNNYALFDDVLYEVHPRFITKEHNDTALQAQLKKAIEVYDYVSKYSCEHNAIIPCRQH